MINHLVGNEEKGVSSKNQKACHENERGIEKRCIDV